MRVPSVLLAMLFMFAAARAAAETPMTVMTFNVRYGTAMDGKFAWPHRKDLLIDTIRQANPVLLGTQECLEGQANYILEKLPEYKMIGRGRDANGKGEMAAIFYKASEMTPVNSGFFWLSETPEIPGSKSWDSDLTRIVTHAQFTHVPSGKTIYYFNTHFDHRGEEARKKSAELLVARIAALPKDALVLVTGDFNAVGGESDPWKTLTGAGLQDAWFTAGERKGPLTTCCGFRAPDPEAKTRIDWILSRGLVRTASCETVVNEKDGLYPSDHYPVVARVIWPF